MFWRKVTVVGVGLLGGSLGLALKGRNLAQQVAGYVRREEAGHEAVRAGAVDEATLDLKKAVQSADLVVLCTPLAQMSPLAKEFAPDLAEGAIVTDVGSVKGPLIAALEPLLACHGGRFVGSHPMAGSEKTGVSAARADLFEGACCVITPTPNSSPEGAALVEELWASVGGRTLRMDPARHDEAVARTSHLPHLLAAHLANCVLAPDAPPEQRRLCAGGFRDCTRVASGSPEMWRDIVLMNREQVSGALAGFRNALEDFQRLLETHDSHSIERLFASARERREGWSAQYSSNPLE